MSTTTRVEPPPPMPRRCAQTYDPLMPLGSGGFGAVWRARHRRLGRLVALKLLHADARPDMVLRMQREARLTAKLSHPHIVKILDHDVEADTAWIAYEDLGGGTLIDRLQRERRLDPADALRMGSQVAAALHEAHEHGILHRDVKADNVLEHAPGSYKLADFGLARGESDDGRLTEDGIVLGTPAYIAPELLQGAPYSAASDQYALGILLYLCLTGVIPHHDKRSVSRTVAARAHEPICRPSTLVASIPARVEAVVMRMLASDPADRYATLRDARLAMDLALRLLARPSTPARRPSTATRVDGSFDRHPSKFGFMNSALELARSLFLLASRWND